MSYVYLRINQKKKKTKHKTAVLKALESEKGSNKFADQIHLHLAQSMILLGFHSRMRSCVCSAITAVESKCKPSSQLKFVMLVSPALVVVLKTLEGLDVLT